MKFRSSWFVCVAASSAALLGGCDRKDAGANRPTGREKGPPKSVQVTRAELRAVERAVPVTGTLAAQEQSTLSSKVSGRLQNVAVDIGSMVRKGDVLAQIEPRDYELRVQQSVAALAQTRAELGLTLSGEDDQVELETVSAVRKARAVLDEAVRNRDRVLNLSKSGIASESELDAVKSAHTVALTSYETAQEEARTKTAALAQRRAEYEIARKQLADASLTAPYDGAIQSRRAGIGEYVAAGTPIVTLVQTDPLRLRLEVPEREAMLVRVGQPVRLRVEGDTNLYLGNIARLAPAITEEDRMLLAEADVPNRGGLRAGLFARAEIIVNERDPSLVLPTNALTVFAGIEKVVTVKDGMALERVVMTGRRGPDWIEIISGLSAGETVVLDPAGMRSGQSVTTGTSPPPTHGTASDGTPSTQTNRARPRSRLRFRGGRAFANSRTSTKSKMA